MTTLDPVVREYYEQNPEESRLEHGPFVLEAARTRELIQRHLPSAPCKLLDVGGAAGAYAFWLAAEGYEVHLVDAVHRLVAEARRRNETASTKLASLRVADARDLPFDAGFADVVLLLGPLYHLVDASARRRALSEVHRVLKPGGLLIAAAISRWASLLDGVSRQLLNDPEFRDIVARDLESGQHRNTTERVDYFTTAYFHRPDDLRDEVAQASFSVDALYGIEGPGWMLPDFSARWSDPEEREGLMRAARLVETEPAMLSCSAHLLIVARASA